MAKTRIITNDVLQRILRAEKELSIWMYDNKICEIDTESCMSILVEKNIYKYDSNNKGHYFREDLRALRDNNQLNLLSDLLIEQKKPGSRWYIRLNYLND